MNDRVHSLDARFPRLAQSLVLLVGLASILLLPRGLMAQENAVGSPSSDGRARGLGVDAGAALSGLADIDDIAEVDLDALLAVPIVTTASRRAQSIHEAPVSISVLTGADIERDRVSHPALLLRRIVGLGVIQINEQVLVPIARGFGYPNSNRVLSLLDGRKFTETYQDKPLWPNLPVHRLDIDRIEVIRGPGSTLYGADAFSGVVSVRTKRPLDHPGHQAEASVGLQYLPDVPDDDLLGPRIQNDPRAFLAYRWASEDGRTGLGASGQFGQQRRWAQGPDASVRTELHGGLNYSARLALDHRPDHSLRSELDLTHALQEGGASYLRLNTRYSEQALRFLVQKGALLDDALTLELSGDLRRHNQTDPNMEEWEQRVDNYRSHLVAQATLNTFSGRNVSTLGFEGTHDWLNNATDLTVVRTYLAGIAQNQISLLADRSVLLDLAVRFESMATNTDTDISLAYWNTSPRATLIWKFRETQDLRLSAGSAFRTPNGQQALFGVQVDPGPAAPDAPLVPLAFPNPELRPETSYSLELGYRGAELGRWSVEGLVYAQRLIDLILPDRSGVPSTYRNTEPLDYGGLETAGTLQISPQLRSYLNYSYARKLSGDERSTTNVFPGHMLGTGLITSGVAGWEASLDLRVESRRDQFFRVSGEEVLLELPTTLLLDLYLGKQVIDERIEVFISGRNLVAFLREPPQLVQFPGYDPIGATVILGISMGDGGDGP